MLYSDTLLRHLTRIQLYNQLPIDSTPQDIITYCEVTYNLPALEAILKALDDVIVATYALPSP